MLFHYRKTANKLALSLAFNITLALALLFLFSILAKHYSDFETTYAIAKPIALIIIALLTVLMLWHLKRDKDFQLYVTENTFHCHHPSFQPWCFRLNTKDITKIVNRHITAGDMTTIEIVMNSGERFQLCQNYPYSREALYRALKIANPLIELPANSYCFTSPLSDESDRTMTARFPVITRLLKPLLRRNKNNR